jgi:hypothetical protein
MPLEPAKCTQCGAKLEVDISKEASICPSCGTAFITSKAVNNYTTNIVNNTIVQGNQYVAFDDSTRLEFTALKVNGSMASFKITNLIKYMLRLGWIYKNTENNGSDKTLDLIFSRNTLNSNYPLFKLNEVRYMNLIKEYINHNTITKNKSSLGTGISMLVFSLLFLVFGVVFTPIIRLLRRHTVVFVLLILVLLTFLIISLILIVSGARGNKDSVKDYEALVEKLNKIPSQNQ